MNSDCLYIASLTKLRDLAWKPLAQVLLSGKILPEAQEHSLFEQVIPKALEQGNLTLSPGAL